MRGDRLLIERGEAAIKDPVDPLIGGAGEIVEGLGRPFRVRHRLARVLEVGRQQRVRLALRPGVEIRSEEHTSELQSLMRISYAVFCLKKKKTTNVNTTSKNTKKLYSRSLINRMNER